MVAQENGRATRPLDIGPDALAKGFSMLAGPGRYDRVVCLGTVEGLPLMTCTAPGPPGSTTGGPAAPSLEYLAHIVIGLRETFDLDTTAIVNYLGSAPGASPDLVRAALVRTRFERRRSGRYGEA